MVVDITTVSSGHSNAGPFASLTLIGPVLPSKRPYPLSSIGIIITPTVWCTGCSIGIIITNASVFGNRRRGNADSTQQRRNPSELGQKT